MKKISIIIPCYNAESSIDRCLASVAAQTIGIDNMEVILVNDASTDGTLEKLCEWEKKYPDSVCVVDCKENGKQGQARNIGMSYATGEYIGFADDDDILEKEMYQILCSSADRVSCDVAVCRSVKHGFPYSWPGDEEEAEEEIIEIHSIEERQSFLERDINIAIWNKIYRRELLLENEIFFLPGYIYDDIYFSGLVKRNCQRVFLTSKVLYHHIISKSSVSYGAKNKLDRIGFIEVHISLIEELRARGIYEEFAAWYEKEFMIDYLSFRVNYEKTFGAMEAGVDYAVRKAVVELFPDFREIPLVQTILAEGDRNKYYFIVHQLEVLDNEFVDNGIQVSVIVPCFNAEEEIDHLMASLANQTVGMECLQVILVNDASEDDTLVHLQWWEQHYTDRVLVVNCDKNVGVSQARNIGLEYADGEFISFLDADDWVEGNYYERMLELAYRYQSDIVICGHDRPDSFVENSQTSLPIKGKERQYNFISPQEKKEFLVSHIFSTSVCWELYRKDFLIGHNLKFPVGIFYEDVYFTYSSYMRAAHISTCSDILYHYYRNNAGTMLGGSEWKQRERLVALRMFYDECVAERYLEDFHDEIELIFIRKYYTEMMDVMFRRFGQVDYSVYLGVADWMQEHFPNCRNNPYLQDSFSELDNMFLKIMDGCGEETLNSIRQKYLQRIYHREKPDSCCGTECAEFYYPQKEEMFAELYMLFDGKEETAEKRLQDVVHLLKALPDVRNEEISYLCAQQVERHPGEVYRYCIDRECILAYLQYIVGHPEEYSPVVSERSKRILNHNQSEDKKLEENISD